MLSFCACTKALRYRVNVDNLQLKTVSTLRHGLFPVKIQILVILFIHNFGYQLPVWVILLNGIRTVISAITCCKRPHLELLRNLVQGCCCNSVEQTLT